MIISYFFLFYEYFVLFLFARKRISPCGTFTAVFGLEQKAILGIRTRMKGRRIGGSKETGDGVGKGNPG
nr:hypothetical protein [Bacillaceae bacterium]